MARRNQKIGVLIIKENPPKYGCLLIDDGIPCEGRHSASGLCRRHHVYCRQNGLLEKFAIQKRILWIDPLVEKEVCRIIDDGEPCELKAGPSGLCSRHRAYLLPKGLFDLYRIPKK
jgi:hypothetical protein